MKWFRPKIPDKRVRLAFISGAIAMLLSTHVLDARRDDSKSFDWFGEGILVAALCIALGQLALTSESRKAGGHDEAA